MNLIKKFTALDYFSRCILISLNTIEYTKTNQFQAFRIPDLANTSAKHLH